MRRNRPITIPCLLLVTSSLTACVTATEHADERVGAERCRAGEMYVCEERINQVVNCSCQRNDKVKDIIEANPF